MPPEATQALYLLNVYVNITNMGVFQNSEVEVTLDIIRHLVLFSHHFPKIMQF
jgi:hypothetical protein